MWDKPKELNQREEGQGLDILDLHISITFLISHVGIAKRAIRHRPATLGMFTIGELQQILTKVQLEPFRESFLFKFSHGRYLVKTYANPDES